LVLGSSPSPLTTISPSFNESFEPEFVRESEYKE
jgi:hypothetical protein